MSVAVFPIFEKVKKVREAIAEMEAAVEGKRIESTDAEKRLRAKMQEATQELNQTRLPIAGALVWKGRRDV